MKILIAVFVLSLATTCLATCMPCTYYQLLLSVVNYQVTQDQLSVPSGTVINLFCAISRGSIDQGGFLSNGSTFYNQSITYSESVPNTFFTAPIFITQELDNNTFLSCEANLSEACELCTSRNIISLHVQVVVTTETPLNIDQSTSEENGEDNKTDVKGSVTPSTGINITTSTFNNTAAGFPYETVLPSTIVPAVFVGGVLIIIALIFCYIYIQRRSPKRKTQPPVLPLCNRDCNSNRGTNSSVGAATSIGTESERVGAAASTATESESVGAAASTATESERVGAAASTGTESERVGAAASTATESERVGAAASTGTESKIVGTDELTADKFNLAIPQAQISGSTNSDLNSTMVLRRTRLPTTPPRSDKHRSSTEFHESSGTSSPEMPHESSGTNSPEDSESSDARKSDENSLADSDGMGQMMALPTIETTSVNGQSINCNQDIFHFSSTTGN